MRNDIATNGPDGFQMDELNFAEQNINAAQDKTQSTQDAKTKLAQNETLVRDQLKKEGFNDSDITKKLNEMGPSEINQLGNRISEANQMLKDRELLAKGDYTEDEINGMTPEDIAEKAAKIRQDQVSIFDNFADAGVALGGLLMSGGAIAFGLATGNFPNTNPNAPQNPIPTPPVATEPKPTRKEEEGDDSSNEDLPEGTSDSPLTMLDLGNRKIEVELGIGQSITQPNTGTFSGVINPPKQGTPRESEAGEKVSSRGESSIKQNPQSSILVLGYNETVVKSLRSTASEREALIRKATSKETILSSEEGKKLKQAEKEAKATLKTVEKSVETANLKYGEAVSAYTSYAESYGKMVTEGKLDQKTAEKLLKDKHDSLVKPAKDNLETTKKSIKTLTEKAKADVDRATKDTDRYVQSEKASITEGINKTKILEAAKQLSKLDIPDLDPKLKSAYSKVELAEKNLLNTKAEPGSAEHKKLLDAYLKEKKNFLKSDVGRDLGRQIDLANAPDVYKDQSYEPLSGSYAVKDTQFKVEPSVRIKINELKRNLESREIQNPESKAKVDTLEKKFELAKSAYEASPKVIEANKKLESLEIDLQKKRSEMDSKQPPATEKERTKIESEMQKKIDAEKKIISDSQKDMLKAEKAYKAERMTALIKEDPNLLGSASPNSLDSANRKDAVYDLFYGKDDRDISSAANSLFDKHVTLGETSPLASKVISDKIIATDSGMLPPGAGFVRYMDFYGERLMLPGVPGSPITSDFGPRTDPGTGGPATHLGADNGVQKGSVIGFPVKAKVFKIDNSDSAGENSRHSQGFGKFVTLEVGSDSDRIRLTVAHNGQILVEKDMEIKPGQAISISSNSGRSIGNPGDHTHVEFSFYAGDDPKTGEPLFKTRVPTKDDIPLLKKVGLIK